MRGAAVTMAVLYPLQRHGSRAWVAFRRLSSGLRGQTLGLAAAATILVYLATAVFAPVLAPFDPAATDLGMRLASPSPGHWFGTDALGRDIFSRTLYGARVSLLVGVLTVGISAAV